MNGDGDMDVLSAYSGNNKIAWYRILSTTSVSSLDLPHNFYLEQNLPNPSNTTTVIRYALPYDNCVTIRIFDLLGKEIAVLENNETDPADWHCVT